MKFFLLFVKQIIKIQNQDIILQQNYCLKNIARAISNKFIKDKDQRTSRIRPFPISTLSPSWKKTNGIKDTAGILLSILETKLR